MCQCVRARAADGRAPPQAFVANYAGGSFVVEQQVRRKWEVLFHQVSRCDADGSVRALRPRRTGFEAQHASGTAGSPELACTIPLAASSERRGGGSLPPPSRTNRTRRVPHPVLIGHAASLAPY